MNEQQLKCFITCADRLNFTRAAEELYLSVPTVSHHIQTLEKELGVILFERSHHQVTLTKAGKAFYPDARDLLIRMHNAKNHVADASAYHHQFRIGCTSEAEIIRMEPVLSIMRQQIKDVYPQFVMDDYAHIVNQLKEYQLDIAFGTSEMFVPEHTVNFHSLSYEGSFAIFLKASHPETPEKISFSHLDQDTLITLSTRMIPFHYGDQIQNLLQNHHQYHNDIFTDTGIQAVTLVRAGYGTAILPRFVLPDLTNELGIARIEEGSSLSYGTAWNKNEINDTLKKVLDILQKVDYAVFPKSSDI